MIRLLFLLHRYLGIAVGVLMVMWCLSGVVMMYASYPDLAESNRLSHLVPITWNGCCKISEQMLAHGEPVSKFQIEMLAGRPVLQLRSGGGTRLIDLITGALIRGVSLGQSVAVARPYAARAESPGPRLLGMIDYDQWTVSGEFQADRPLYHFGLGDDKGTELYVSSTTGHAVQLTTARERFWNWLGSVPHWLYFAELRHRPALWSQIVIWTSLIGCFLAATGLYIGVRQLLRRPDGLWSPYRGFNLWHHIAGLVFGVFTLTWVLSGLLSMNPWGLLEGSGSETERARLNGSSQPSGAQIKAAIQAMAISHPADMLSIKIAPLNGEVYFIANTADGNRRRLSAAAQPAPLNRADLEYIAVALSGGIVPSVPSLLTQEDTYYFSHHSDRVALPVYRMILPDGSATRYYIDAVSGMLTAKIDRSARRYRWLHEGLHRLDFTAALRGRPQWDALMLLLMSGVTTVCATGAYLGYRRLLRLRTADNL
jgi:PepSY-associated TM region